MADEACRSPAAELSVSSNGDSGGDVFQRVRNIKPFNYPLTHSNNSVTLLGSCFMGTFPLQDVFFQESGSLCVSQCLCVLDGIVGYIIDPSINRNSSTSCYTLQDASRGLSSGPITSHVHSVPDHGMMSEGVVAVGPYTGTGDHLSLFCQNTCC